MILHGHKKRVLSEIVAYYVKTTGNEYQNFINDITATQGVQLQELTDSQWLAVKSYEKLKEFEISLEDCIENKDIINASINSSSSREEGEFFTPQVWCVDGREYLKDMLGDLWGKAYVWDASCYTMDTEILTQRGWVTYDNLKDDDSVYSLNNETMQGEFVRFHSRFKKPVNEDLVHFETRGLDLLVTKDHSMFTRELKESRETSFGFQTAIEVYNYMREIKSNSRRMSIPVSAKSISVEHTEKYSEKEGLFWKFIGFYLGDGFLIKSRDEVNYTKIRFSLKKERKIDYLIQLLNKMGVEYVVNDYLEKGGHLNINVKDEKLLRYISDLNLVGSANKYIPYDDIKTEYYEDLFEGLLNSDGNLTEYGSVEYATISSKFAEDIDLLLHMLGYSVKTHVKQDKRNRANGEPANKVYRVIGSHLQVNSVTNAHVKLIPYEGYVWDITLDRNHVFKVRRNGKSCFSGNCGTGNLMRTAEYPTDKLFLSSLLPEDVEIIKNTPEYNGAEVFQLDFLENLDYDENNLLFSQNLPPKLLEVLKNNEPLVFYMNPPYKTGVATRTDVGAYMASQGMSKCGLDLFNQFMYRILLLQETFNLTNLYAGIFGPVTMFHSPMIADLYNEWKSVFKFQGGMCFNAAEFSSTSESVGWMVGYTTWRIKQQGEEDKSIVLDAKDVGPDGNLRIFGQRLITDIDLNLDVWVKPNDVVAKDMDMPYVTSYQNFKNTIVKAPSNALGFLMTSNYVIRATRRASVLSVPAPDTVPITFENFYRCLASFAARRIYATKQDPYNNSQYYSAPDVTKEGYDVFLANALMIYLFDTSSQFASYRNHEGAGSKPWSSQNKMFPINVNSLENIVTDPALLEDLQNNPPQNEFILAQLSQAFHLMYPEALELYEIGLKVILESLSGTRRKDLGYQNDTLAWDAGIIQIRNVPNLVPQEDLDNLGYALSKLKHKLMPDIYKYGFLMDTAFEVEQPEDEEVDELDEELV